jgi:hypothetical protein
MTSTFIDAAPPRLTSMHKPIDTSPECFGELQSSIGLLGDPEALRARMDAEGYLYLPGYLDREEVLAARLVMAERLAARGYLDPAAPLIECKAHPQAAISFLPDLAENNPQLSRLLYDGRMMAFWDRFLGGEARHFDFTWVRAVAPGRGTPPHMDVVYMGRGTRRLYTAWTPLGDVPLSVGGLLVLERSHLHERLNSGYGSKDVDAFCENKVGPGYTRMGGGGNITDGGWLSKNPVKLRKNLGGRWLSANYRAGDLLVFSVFTVHTSLDNQSDQIRLSTDTRYQLASEPVDERWIGEHPIGHGPQGKRGMIC